jgi:uncharacterized phage protein (TIGR02220 family)
MERDTMICALAEVIRDLAVGGKVSDACARLLSIVETAQGIKQLTLATEEGQPLATPKLNKSQRETQAVLEVFKYWQSQTGRSKTRLVPERRDKIRARLRQGFTIQDLKEAVVGATMSEHHSSNQEWLDITTIFKNGSVVENHIARKRGGDCVVEETSGVVALRARLAQAKADNNVEEYNKLNRELRDELRRTGKP